MNNLAILKSVALNLLILTIGCGRVSEHRADANANIFKCPSYNSIQAGMEIAASATELAQSAQSSQDWDLVVLKWIQAIEAMQSVSVANPQHTFAQKKATEFSVYWQAAQQKAEQVTRVLAFDSFKSKFLNQQLQLYLSYVAVMGTPDILIVGSSRALQGIDPRVLQKELAKGHQHQFKVFNLGINGATAQVVDLVIREILQSQYQPRLIIWGDGVRAFNSGRLDLTYNGIINSLGYQKLVKGERPSIHFPTPQTNQNCQPVLQPSPLQASWYQDHLSQFFQLLSAQATEVNKVNNIDANGFLPVSDRFEPQSYYQEYPRVAGLYDGDYQKFDLAGEQAAALRRLINYTTQQQIPLIFVSLPLTQYYLDPVRQNYEQEFSNFMTQQAQQPGFVFLDFSQQFPHRNSFFADPSHLNRYGAAAVSAKLAASEQIPFSIPY